MLANAKYIPSRLQCFTLVYIFPLLYYRLEYLDILYQIEEAVQRDGVETCGQRGDEVSATVLSSHVA